MSEELTQRLATTAFAFRGYNVTNLGRTPELLEHPAYGPIIERHLKTLSEVFTAATLRRCDLVKRVRLREETNLASYAEAICIISAASLAQLEILKDLFGIEIQSGKLALGYSLGEVIALVATGVYTIEALLTPILKFADQSVELAQRVRMGVVFSRGPILNTDAVERVCVHVSTKGQGTVAISTYLAPNSVLVLAQDRSLELFRDAIREQFHKEIMVKTNPHHWPPIHTPIVRQMGIADKAAVMLETIPGGLRLPVIPIESCVTGRKSYTDYNSRRILADWIIHPQRLWGVLEQILNSDVSMMIHVGPEPNIIPATFERIRNNVDEQLKQNSLTAMGLRAVSQIIRARPWVSQYLSKHTALLRVPQIRHIILEDWLLANVPA